MRRKIAFLGIDLGTTGIRAILADEKGSIIASRSIGVEASFIESESEKQSEQNPKEWEPALFNVLKPILASLDQHQLEAITVDSTSGTILPVDRDGNPLHNALLHNDIRAHDEADFISSHTNLIMQPTFALSKILWMKRHNSRLFDQTYKFIHAADYLKGLISGDFETSDFSNAVKTGYDLSEYKWPDCIEGVLEIPVEKLPGVVKTGEVVGELKQSIRDEFGIRNRVLLVAGATDSTTSFFSSGARAKGDWNTTLGTVLGIRGITESFIRDPEGLIYAHRHPEGYWLPGAASNTGGEALRMFFKDDIKEYDRKIENLPPTGALVYPLARKSEKFPFHNLDAHGFIIADLCDPVSLFKAFLEGAGFLERMIYDKIREIGYAVGDRIFSMGGGAYSTPWMNIRAAILKRPIIRAKEVETAFGSAIIAASGVHYENLTGAIEHMVKEDLVVEPDGEISAEYDELYGRFIQECRKRNFF